MKYRLGFVSNSSSSCFIVVDNSPISTSALFDGRELLVIDTLCGEHEFGRSHLKCHDMYSKIIFAYLQTWYDCQSSETKGRKNLELLEQVIKETLHVKNIEWKLNVDDYDDNYAYIDHQSVGYWDGDGIFTSKEQLACFLFNPESYIEMDGDG